MNDETKTPETLKEDSFDLDGADILSFSEPNIPEETSRTWQNFSDYLARKTGFEFKGNSNSLSIKGLLPVDIVDSGADLEIETQQHWGIDCLVKRIEGADCNTEHLTNVTTLHFPGGCVGVEEINECFRRAIVRVGNSNKPIEIDPDIWGYKLERVYSLINGARAVAMERFPGLYYILMRPRRGAGIELSPESDRPYKTKIDAEIVRMKKVKEGRELLASVIEEYTAPQPVAPASRYATLKRLLGFGEERE